MAPRYIVRRLPNGVRWHNDGALGLFDTHTGKFCERIADSREYFMAATARWANAMNRAPYWARGDENDEDHV